MATNSIVNSYGTGSEQDLLADLTQEAIQQRGIDVLYLPRRQRAFDKVYTEDAQEYFDKAAGLDVYVDSFEGFQGDGHFMGQIGVQMRDQVHLTVSTRTFLESVGNDEGFTRPREGDLIFFPLSNRLFEIMFVDKYSNFFPLGSLPSYGLRCEVFEFSGMVFETGIPAIDAINTRLGNDVMGEALATEAGPLLASEDGDYIVPESYDPTAGDPLDDSQSIQAEADAIQDFTELDPFSEGVY